MVPCSFLLCFEIKFDGLHASFCLFVIVYLLVTERIKRSHNCNILVHFFANKVRNLSRATILGE